MDYYLHKIQSLSPIFSKYEKIVAVYLFGSASRGGIGPMSDIDFAALTKSLLTLDDEAEIIGEIVSLLENDRVDFVSIDENSPVLLRERIIEGKVIYSADEKERIDFEKSTMDEYLFMKPFYAEYDYLFSKEVSGWRKG